MNSSISANARQYQLKGEVDVQNILTDTESTMGLDIVKTDRTSTKGVISNVHPGSPAAQRGLRPGDKVLDEKIRGSWLEITIERAGKTYQATLSEFGQEALTPRMAPANQSPELKRLLLKLQALEGRGRNSDVDYAARLNESSKKELLASRDVVILIDKSASMSTKDCPNEQTRWDWCAAESSKFGQQYDTAASRNLSLVLFDSEAREFPNVPFSTIRHLFVVNRPGGGTNTAGAVESQTDKLFAHSTGRPLVIAVITDGLPNDLNALRKAIIHASRRERYRGELTIVFLQIGNERIADDYLDELDNGLVGHGASDDIVEVKSFRRLQQLGLRDVIINSIVNTSLSKR